MEDRLKTIFPTIYLSIEWKTEDFRSIGLPLEQTSVRVTYGAA